MRELMKKHIKVISVIMVVIVLIITLGIGYAIFNYNKTGISNKIIAGTLYLTLNEGNDSISLENVFPESKEEARAKDNNTITFTLKGKNTSPDKAINYEIILNNGDDSTNPEKERYQTKDLVFDLVEIGKNNEETMILDAVSYETLENQKIWIDKVDENTNDEIERTYQLRMWVSEDVVISDSDPNADYTTDEYKNLYANVKVAVEGDLQDKVLPLTVTTDNQFVENGQTYFNTVIKNVDNEANDDTYNLTITSSNPNIQFVYKDEPVVTNISNDNKTIKVTPLVNNSEEELEKIANEEIISDNFAQNYTIANNKKITFKISLKTKDGNQDDTDLTFSLKKNGVVVQTLVKHISVKGIERGVPHIEFVNVNTPYTGNGVTLGTVTITNSDNTPYTGTPKYTYYKGNSCSGQEIVEAPVNAGTYSVKIFVEGAGTDSDYTSCGVITIAKKEVTANVLDCENREYDGTTNVSCRLSVTGTVGSDTVIANGSCNVADGNVGTGKSVTCSSPILDGKDKDNYTIANNTITTTEEIDITKAIPVVTMSQTSGSASVGSPATFDVQANTEGVFTVVTSDTTYAEATIANTGIVAANTNNTVTVNALSSNETTDASVTVTIYFTPSDTSNYYSLTQTENQELAKTYSMVVNPRKLTAIFDVNGNGKSSLSIPTGCTRDTTTGNVSCSCLVSGNGTTCTINTPKITAPSSTPSICGYTQTSTGVSTGCITHNTEMTITANTTYYAQTYKSTTTRTATFNKNGASTQTDSSGSAVSSTTVTRSCTISPTYNGESQASGCSVTSPIIVGVTDFDVIGYNTSSSAQTSTWDSDTAKDITSNVTYYAITKNNVSPITVTFYLNGNVSQTVSGGTASTEESVSQSCYRYNGSSGCIITSPTFVAPENTPTHIGYSQSATDHERRWTENVGLTVTSNTSYYAQSQKVAVDYPITYTNLSILGDNIETCTIPATYNGVTQGTSCTMNLASAPVVVNRTFTGWKSVANNTIYSAGDSYTTTGAASFEAQWTLDIKTLTFNAAGGTFSNNETSNIVKYNQASDTVTKYSHTENIDDTGKKNSDYGSNWTNANIRGTDRTSSSTEAHVITIPGASTLTVDVYYNGEGSSYDWVSIWSGSHPSYTAASNSGSAISGGSKLGGTQSGTYTVNGNSLTSMGHSTFTINDSSVTFGFKSDSSSVGQGYGYYAIVSSTAKQDEITSGTYLVPTKPKAIFLGWKSSVDNEIYQDITSMPFADATLTAQWESLERILTFDANGGTFSNSASTNTINIEQVNGETVTKYSHTENIDDTGKKNSDYGSNWTNANIRGTDRTSSSTEAHVITIPGASTLTVDVYYNGEGSSYDWVSIWSGSHPSYTAASNYNSGITNGTKLGAGQSGTYTVNGNSLTSMGHSTFTINDSSVTFGFKSDGSGAGQGYGYYAIITGTVKTNSVSSGTYLVPTKGSATFLGWKSSVDNEIYQDITAMPFADATLTAQWEEPPTAEAVSYYGGRSGALGCSALGPNANTQCAIDQINEMLS